MHVYQEARLAGRVSQGLPRLKILLIRYCMCMRIMLGVVSMQIHGQCTPSWPQLDSAMGITCTLQLYRQGAFYSDRKFAFPEVKYYRRVELHLCN